MRVFVRFRALNDATIQRSIGFKIFSGVKRVQSIPKSCMSDRRNVHER